LASHLAIVLDVGVELTGLDPRLAYQVPAVVPAVSNVIVTSVLPGIVNNTVAEASSIVTAPVLLFII